MATHTTTAGAIRDRIAAVIEAITPNVMSGDRFRAYRNEGDADFVDWAQKNPAGARRRFQVRHTVTEEDPPANTNRDVEEHRVTMSILVAYPQTGRDGSGQALDRDDAMDSDERQIDDAVGLRGRAQLSYPNADACYDGLRSTVNRLVGTTCDFLEIVASYTYKRDMS